MTGPAPMGSATITKLIPALIAAKGEFTAVVKDKNNPAFKTKYADLGAVLDAVEPALLKHELVLLQPTGIDMEGRFVCYTFLVHTSGEFIASEYPLRPVKEDPQGYGSALTYARRYQALAILGLAPEDDDGAAASQKRAPAAPPRDFKKEIEAAPNIDALTAIVQAVQAAGEWAKFGTQAIEKKAALEAATAQDAPQEEPQTGEAGAASGS